MHNIEPFYQWKELYEGAEDKNNPFYGEQYNEFQYTNKIYNYFIHPQWDKMESETLYLKILFVDYDDRFCIIELIGEWNDCINNDIMFLKRDIIDHFIKKGLNKYIILCDHVLNFHGSDDCYYEEWKDDVEDGAIYFINLLPHVYDEMKSMHIQNYVVFQKKNDQINWRKMNPMSLLEYLENKN
jgi:hypothetical protein